MDEVTGTRTAFGASWELPPTAVAAVLRAQAAGIVNLLPVDPTDAAAAVVVAHVWARVLGESTLAAASRHLPGDLAVAVAALSRAAGHRTGPLAPGDLAGLDDLEVTPSRAAEMALDPAWRWLRDQQPAGVNVAQASLRAAFDLSAGAAMLGTPALPYAAVLTYGEAREHLGAGLCTHIAERGA